MAVNYIPNPSQGSQFSDGVRVGPGFQAQYTTGIGGTPPVLLETASLNKAPGTQLASWAVYDIAPAASAVNNLSLAATTVGAGYLTLAPAAGVTRVSKFGLTNVLELDVPRAVSLTQAAAGNVGQLTVTGYDQYGIRMQELITSIVDETVDGVKAFKWITALYFSAASGTNISVGTANVFGLPWRVDNSNYINYAFEGIPEVPFDTITGNATFVDAATPQVITGIPYMDADTAIIWSVITPNGPDEVTITRQNGVGFTFTTIDGDTSVVSWAVFPSPAAIEGQGSVVFTPAYNVVGADPFPPSASTLTTPDVRGTLAVQSIDPDGILRLSAFAYVLGSNPLPDTTIRNLDMYSNASIPNELTLNGYAQFWSSVNSGS